jgi:hypothetical protein
MPILEQSELSHNMIPQPTHGLGVDQIFYLQLPLMVKINIKVNLIQQ